VLLVQYRKVHLQVKHFGILFKCLLYSDRRNLVNNILGEGRGESTVDIMNFNLRRSQFRKGVGIVLVSI